MSGHGASLRRRTLRTGSHEAVQAGDDDQTETPYVAGDSGRSGFAGAHRHAIAQAGAMLQRHEDFVR